MMAKLKALVVGAVVLMLAGCVTVEPEPPVIVNGAAGYLEKLPYLREVRLRLR